jgi:hypothetical protein
MQARDAGVVADDRCGSFSTELGCPRHVRFTPDSDRTADVVGGPLRARLGHGDNYSITSSARARSMGGRSRPRDFAASD